MDINKLYNDIYEIEDILDNSIKEHNIKEHNIKHKQNYNNFKFFNDMRINKCQMVTTPINTDDKISNNIIPLESRCDYQSIHGHLEHDPSLEPQHILYHERNNPFRLTICI